MDRGGENASFFCQARPDSGIAESALPSSLVYAFELPSNHPSQSHFQAYRRAEAYSKHAPDPVQLVAHDFARAQTASFKTKEPVSAAAFQPSFYPKTQLSTELEAQLHLLQAYHSLEQQPVPSKPVPVRPQTASSRKRRSGKAVLGFQYYRYVEKLGQQFDKQVKRSPTAGSNSYIQSIAQKRNQLYATFKELLKPKELAMRHESRSCQPSRHTFRLPSPVVTTRKRKYTESPSVEPAVRPRPHPLRRSPHASFRKKDAPLLAKNFQTALSIKSLASKANSSN